MSRVNDGQTVIKFTPYQFLGLVVMFIGLVGTAIGPYIAVKADIGSINIKVVELKLQLTHYLAQDMLDKSQMVDRIKHLEKQVEHNKDEISNAKLIDSLTVNKR